MILDIDNIKDLIRDNKIQWRGHMLARMQQRGILLNNVLQCILNGEIIEVAASLFNVAALISVCVRLRPLRNNSLGNSNSIFMVSPDMLFPPWRQQ